MSQKHSPYFIYILECSDKTLYTGITWDLEKRLRQHNGEIVGGAKYTRARRPTALVYSEKVLTHKEACAREAEIKAMSREEKVKLLKSIEKYT
ncbi:MAG: GIY-YIG nuclease family protein [Patescibacteria group bacterium]